MVLEMQQLPSIRWRLALACLILSGQVATAADNGENLVHELLQLAGPNRQQALQKHFSSRPVTWPEASSSLADRLKRLTNAQTAVLLELGVNETANKAHGHFSGGWWKAILALCKEHGLEPVPPQKQRRNLVDNEAFEYLEESDVPRSFQHVFGGPLMLRPQSNASAQGILANAQACGPLLVETTQLSTTLIRRLQGSVRSMDLRFRLRLEPGLRSDLVTACAIVWTGATNDTKKTVHILRGKEEDLLIRSLRNREVPKDDTNRISRFNNNDSNRLTPTGHVRIDEIPDGSSSIHLTGKAVLTCETSLRLAMPLVMDDNRTIPDSPVPISCVLKTNSNLQTARRFPFQVDVSYRSNDLQRQPRLQLTDKQGRPVQNFSRSTSSDGDRTTLTLYLTAKPQEGVTLHMRPQVALGTVELPLQLTVPLP